MDLRLRVVAVVTFAAALMIGGWPGSAQAEAGYAPKLVKAAKAEGGIVVYGSMRRNQFRELAQLYEKKFGIKVQWTRKSTGGVTRMIEAEKLAGRPRWDVVGVGDESVIRRWLKEGGLMPYNPVNSRFLPEQYRGGQGYLKCSYINMYVIAYNKTKVSPEEAPKNWKDLLHPRWKGRMSMVHPRTASASRILLALAHDRYGWDFFRDLKKNEPLVMRSVSALPPLLLNGEADLVFPVNESDIHPKIARGEKLAVVYPTDFIATGTSLRAISRKAPHPNAAKLWLEFELSPEAQGIYAKHGRYVLHSKVKSPYPRPPLKDLKIAFPSIEQLSKVKSLTKEFVKIMGKAPKK